MAQVLAPDPVDPLLAPDGGALVLLTYLVDLVVIPLCPSPRPAATVLSFIQGGTEAGQPPELFLLFQGIKAPPRAVLREARTGPPILALACHSPLKTLPAHRASWRSCSSTQFAAPRCAGLSRCANDPSAPCWRWPRRATDCGPIDGGPRNVYAFFASWSVYDAQLHA